MKVFLFNNIALFITCLSILLFAKRATSDFIRVEDQEVNSNITENVTYDCCYICEDSYCHLGPGKCCTINQQCPDFCGYCGPAQCP